MVDIRPARPDDIQLVATLVRELAAYEKLTDSVVSTPEDFARALFGEPPRAHALILEADGQPAGFALYFYIFSTFAGRPGLFLEDLFVRPAYRGKGIGKALLAYLAKLCVEKGWARLQWSVLDWNTPSIAFYKSLGAVMMDEWTVCRVNGPALAALAKAAP